MIFNEIYSAYYTAVSRILSAILQGERSEKHFRAIVEECAFGESAVSILPALKSGRWQLVRSDMTATVKNPHSVPMTKLEKSWLKAVSLDPRVRLFDISFDWLGDVEPLFTPEDYRIYDQYGDGDPFTDEGYIERFRFILSAIGERKPVIMEMLNRNGERIRIGGIPDKLEYSAKDDKFRVIMSGNRRTNTVNLGRVLTAREFRGEYKMPRESKYTHSCELVITVDDYRNALERVMLHFAHFEKRAERVDGSRYRLRIKYDQSDETEMVIRVLSFGPMVKVESPDGFVELIRDRLRRQRELFSNQ